MCRCRGETPAQYPLCKHVLWHYVLHRHCSCLRNVVALFHVLEKEMAWRESTGKPTYGALNAYKPIVAVGAEHALEDEQLVADHFRKCNFVDC